MASLLLLLTLPMKEKEKRSTTFVFSPPLLEKGLYREDGGESKKEKKRENPISSRAAAETNCPNVAKTGRGKEGRGCNRPSMF